MTNNNNKETAAEAIFNLAKTGAKNQAEAATNAAIAATKHARDPHGSWQAAGEAWTARRHLAIAEAFATMANDDETRTIIIGTRTLVEAATKAAAEAETRTHDAEACEAAAQIIEIATAGK